MPCVGKQPLPKRGHKVKVRLLSVFIIVSTAVGAGVSLLSTNPLASGAATTPASSQYLNGPSHSSYYPSATSITPQAIAAGNLQPLWRWSVPASPNSGHSSMLASPTIVNGVIYIGANDGYFYAVSESTRSVIWSQFVGIDTGKPNGGCGSGTAGIISTAAVVTDPTTGHLTVYVNGPDGNLYALNAATGKIVWKSVVDTPSTLVNDYYAWGSPLVVNGKVYIGISSECDVPLVPGGLDAFNQSTGALLARWNSVPAGALGGSIWSSAAALSNGAIIATTGNANTATQPPHNESIVRLGGTNLQ
jgi:outer membrane protein assembly factor BamB